MKRIIIIVVCCLGILLPALAQQKGAATASKEDLYRQLLENKIEGSVIVYVGSKVCTPCEMLLNRLKNDKGVSRISNWHAKGIKFIKLDMRKEKERGTASFVNQRGIQGVPVLVFIKNGKEVARLKGFSPKEDQAAKTIQQLDQVVEEKL